MQFDGLVSGVSARPVAVGAVSLTEKESISKQSLIRDTENAVAET